MIILPTNPPTTDHIGGIINIPLRAEWYDSIFENNEKMEKSTIFSAPFEL